MRKFQVSRRLARSARGLRAERCRQGFKVPGYEQESGIAIDFDKDPTSKRNKQYELQRTTVEARDRAPYFCLACGAKCFALAHNKQLASLPKRRTDGSSVVDEKRYLRDMCVCEGAPARPCMRAHVRRRRDRAAAARRGDGAAEA